jgi:uncharacterized membrane protein
MLLVANFLITIVIEYVMLGLFRRKQLSVLGLIVFGVHFITHPVGAWLLFVQDWNYFLVEGLIVVVEALLYFVMLSISIRRAVLYSLVANVASIAVGVLIATVVAF